MILMDVFQNNFMLFILVLFINLIDKYFWRVIN